jgi:hypothetical protein
MIFAKSVGPLRKEVANLGAGNPARSRLSGG